MSEQTLAGIGILAGLTAADREALEKRCRWRRFSAGEQIIDRTAESQDVYFVVSGAVRVVNYAASGREVSFADIAAGDCFGELAALDGQRRSAAVVASAPTLAATLPSAAFIDLLAQQPQVALALMQRLARVIRQSTGRIMTLSTQGTHQRVYAELLRAAGAKQDDTRATIRPLPTHAEIAARISTTRETVARTLAELARKKLVRREGRALHIVDVARLRDLLDAGEEY